MINLELSPLYKDLTFLSPLSKSRSQRICSFIASYTNRTVIDIGCGWGALLTRLLESEPSIRGWGIDLDSEAISYGQRIAQERGVADRITLISGDARESLPDKADGVLCIGASQIWGPPVEANMPIDYQSALRAVRSLLKPGLPAVFGESIWMVEPTPEAMKQFSGRRDEFFFLPDLLDVAQECGFVVMSAHQATLDEWDQFESGFTAGYARWLAEHAKEHPNAPEVHARLHAQSNAYFRGYRGVLGMAYLELLAI